MNQKYTVFACIIACFSFACGVGPQSNPTPSNLSIEFTGEAKHNRDNQEAFLCPTQTNSACQITAIWTICTDETFHSYALYRSTSPNISLAPEEAQLLCVITSSEQNSYVDESVIGAKDYYYALETINIAEISSWSNEAHILTPSGNPPTPSVLSASTDAISAYLYWTPCGDSDFTSYTLYRAAISGISSDTTIATNLGCIYNAQDSSFTDSDYYGQSAYYTIRTLNDFGQSSWSNEVQAVFRDSSIVAWGEGDCEVPAPNYGFIDISAGDSFRLGLRSNGSIAAWGGNIFGQCDVPSPNDGFIAVSAGISHSLGLKEDGSIVAWGLNNVGQCDVPSPNEDFVAISAGHHHSLGLKANGSIVAWGYNTYGQCDIPDPNSGFVQIASGAYYNLALKEDGSIVAWGHNSFGQCDIPYPNTGFVFIAAGEKHSLGIKENGSIVAWGYNPHGQCDVPSPNSGFIAVDGGENHSLGVKQDGSVVAWGYNDYYGQCDLPTPNADFFTVAAGGDQSMALRMKSEY